MKSKPKITCGDVVLKLDDFCTPRGFEYGVKIEIASECCWSAEVRMTPQPNTSGRPDFSYVFYAGGGSDAVDVLQECVNEAIRHATTL